MLILDQIFNKKKSKLTKSHEVDQQEEKRASLDEKTIERKIIMDLSQVHFTKKDVEEFMDSLNIDAILKIIDQMPEDDNGKSNTI